MNELAVLMSTYNGEKYVKEQLESILTQEYEGKITVIIRDDGSTDSTCSIVDSIALRDSRVKLIRGENLGYVASFFTLIKTVAEDVEKYDYYALSDQDDVWLPDKLQTAVNVLSKKNNDIPQLYGSRSTLVTENLEPICDSIPKEKEITFFNSIIQNFTAGHTQVMNRRLIECLTDVDASKVYVHDSYILNVAIIKGEMTFDNTTHALYRQHQANELGASRKLLKWIKSHISRVKRGDGAKYSRQIMYICSRFSKDLTDEQKAEMKMFFRNQKNALTRIKYIKRTKLYRQQFRDDVAFRILYLIGGYKF